VRDMRGGRGGGRVEWVVDGEAPARDGTFCERLLSLHGVFGTIRTTKAVHVFDTVLSVAYPVTNIPRYSALDAPASCLMSRAGTLPALI
jgi:hypothetical protein